MTKREQRAQNLVTHYQRLERLFNQQGGKTASGKVITGKRLSLDLLRLETQAHRITTAECNGTATEEDRQRLIEILTATRALLPNVEGIFINGDARGYALKIDDKAMRAHAYNLTQDWGGYGILSPEIK
jgi:hypothetical protein